MKPNVADGNSSSGVAGDNDENNSEGNILRRRGSRGWRGMPKTASRSEKA